MATDTGTVVTVDGRLDPDDLGVTLPHEHLFADWTDDKYTPPDSAYERKLAEEPISLENLWYVRKNYLQHRDNLKLDSVEEAVDEVMRFQRAGGDALVDVTPKGVGGDPELVRGVSRTTGVHMIHGTAFYTRSSHPERVDGLSTEEISDEFVDDVRNGIGETDVRAGIIGEIGTSGQIHEQEEKVLRAGARAAVRTGAPITLHTAGARPESHEYGEHPPSRWGLRILDIVEEEGLEPERVVLGHMDMSIWYEDLEYQRELAERGAYVEYDIFGQKSYLYKERFEDAWPSDVQRVERLAELIEDGYADRLLISQDVFLKCHRLAYGGFGYAHILENVVPILEGVGVSKAQVNLLLRENPRRLLTFDESAD